ncbi:MAG: hypothetical protein GX422_01605 [Deltaproteobacteria bacterium]|jgi:hypothetical protein|nr:hypothetical protein [Deltaproteobacteria bacterium]
MAKKQRHLVRGVCPHCACGDVSFVPSEEMRKKYIGPEEEIEILCPTCGTKHKGKLVIEEEKEQA